MDIIGIVVAVLHCIGSCIIACRLTSQANGSNKKNLLKCGNRLKALFLSSLPWVNNEFHALNVIVEMQCSFSFFHISIFISIFRFFLSSLDRYPFASNAPNTNDNIHLILKCFVYGAIIVSLHCVTNACHLEAPHFCVASIRRGGGCKRSSWRENDSLIAILISRLLLANGVETLITGGNLPGI